MQTDPIAIAILTQLPISYHLYLAMNTIQPTDLHRLRIRGFRNCRREVE